MTTKTVACVDCGESVPYGRLSCSACGALLASVAGAWRSSAVPAGAAGRVEPDEFIEADLSAVSAESAEPIEAAESVPAAWPFGQSLADAVDDPEPAYRAAPTGVYRPPALAFSTATATATAGATNWPSATVPVAAGQGAISSETAATGEAAPRAPAVPAARFVEISGWFVIVGAAMAALGFLLPWSRVVIGARSFGGYFDSWGLASPTHVLVLLAILATLALGILQTPIPTWLRSGVVGLALGGLLVGLTWPYLVGPLGADVGIVIVALGGLALVIGGVVASWATRHPEVEPFV